MATNQAHEGEKQAIHPTVIPGLYQIALPTPFPVGDVNCFLAVGEPLTLIDCGVKSQPSRTALEAALDSLGYHLADIQRLVITHHHTDHCGLAGELVAESGAEVWAHPRSVPWVEDPAGARAASREFLVGVHRAAGVPDEKIEAMANLNRYFESLQSQTRVTHTINEGDTLQMGGLMWRVYHTPGHAGDQVCFYQPERGVLLSADHVLKKTSSNPLIEAPDTPGGPRPQRLLEYMHHLERIAALNPNIAYGGHGDPVTDVPGLVAERLAMHARRADRLHGFLCEGPRTVYELGQKMFARAGDSELFLVISEVIGHLDMLIRAGRVRKTHPQQGQDQGVDYWSAVDY